MKMSTYRTRKYRTLKRFSSDQYSQGKNESEGITKQLRKSSDFEDVPENSPDSYSTFSPPSFLNQLETVSEEESVSQIEGIESQHQFQESPQLNFDSGNISSPVLNLYEEENPSNSEDSRSSTESDVEGLLPYRSPDWNSEERNHFTFEDSISPSENRVQSLAGSPVSNFEDLGCFLNQSFATQGILQPRAGTSSETCPALVQLSGESLRTKLHVWAIQNRYTLTRNCIEGLLSILKSEGIPNIPKSAATLMPSRSTADYGIRLMMSARDKSGYYVYFGITKALKKIIDPEVYVETEISLLINVDGMQVFINSRQQLWPILGKVICKGYKSTPFVIALFGGDSKPASLDDYLKDFVQEVNQLTRHGITIAERSYVFKLKGFVCDTPARSFLKGCKSHGGFYACERCEICGVTVNNKRIYPDKDCRLRTNSSFRNRDQIEHHVQSSPLEKIENFDIVKSFLLDSMHLFWLGKSKFLLQRLLGQKRLRGKLSVHQKEILRELLGNVSEGVTSEFQRKNLNVDDLANWKATQYRLFLLYCSAFVLKYVLDKTMYKHFMLLFVASRILFSADLAMEHKDYANDLLRQYFTLLPTFYGEDSQVMNAHNLIHVADDVKQMQASLSEFSAFEFENCLGKLKSLIKSRKDIVPQIIKRLSELEYCPQTSDNLHHAANNILKREQNLFIEESKESSTLITSITLRNMLIKNTKPDNTILLDTNEFFKIVRIFKEGKNLSVEGHIIRAAGDSFDYPCASSEIGIRKLGLQIDEKETMLVERIRNKCVILEVRGEKHAIPLLHVRE